MRKVHILTSLAAVMIVTAAVWVKTSNNSDDLGQTHVTSSVIESDIENSSHSEEVTEPADEEKITQEEHLSTVNSYQQKIKFSRKYYRAKTGADAQLVIDELYDMGLIEEAEEAETVLAEMCQMRPVDTSIDFLQEPVERLNRYCSGVAFDDDSFVDISSKFWNKNATDSAQLEKQYLSTPENERDAWMWDKIADATSLHDLEMIRKLVITLPNINKFDRYGFDLGQNRILFNGTRGREIQTAALHLYQCEQFAGSFCGPNNIRTIENCLHTGLCQPGWSLQDFYANTFSNVDQEQIDLILAFLRELNER